MRRAGLPRWTTTTEGICETPAPASTGRKAVKSASPARTIMTCFMLRTDLIASRVPVSSAAPARVKKKTTASPRTRAALTRTTVSAGGTMPGWAGAWRACDLPGAAAPAALRTPAGGVGGAGRGGAGGVADAVERSRGRGGPVSRGRLLGRARVVGALRVVGGLDRRLDGRARRSLSRHRRHGAAGVARTARGEEGRGAERDAQQSQEHGTRNSHQAPLSAALRLLFRCRVRFLRERRFASRRVAGRPPSSGGS